MRSTIRLVHSPCVGGGFDSADEPEVQLASNNQPTAITPAMRTRDKSIVLKPGANLDEYEAALKQGARRRNLDESVVISLADTAIPAARNGRGVDKKRFDEEPNYAVNVTLDYLDSIADQYPNLRPKSTVQTTVPQSDITLNIEKKSESASTGVAEATTGPQTTQATQLADLLNLPMATDMPPSTKRAIQNESLPPGATIDADGTVHLKGEISKFSPDAPDEPAVPTKREALTAIRKAYDLRGLDPDEIDAVVGRALEARRIAATARTGNSQLLETESGYILLDKSTGNMTPLTSGGKVDTKKKEELSRLGTLSSFSREMSTPDFQIRPKMSESQAKSLEFGSRALQANERQHRLDAAYADRPEELANEKTAILTTLEALPPDTNMGLATQVLGAVAALGSIGGDLTKWALKFFTDNPNATVKQIEDALVGVGFSAAEARSKALLAKRAALSPDQKEFLDNQLNFSTAVLRRDSGAAISTGEFISTYRQYFPTAGDTRRDVLRKMRTRQQTIRGMRSSAGRPLLIPDIE